MNNTELHPGNEKRGWSSSSGSAAQREFAAFLAARLSPSISTKSVWIKRWNVQAERNCRGEIGIMAVIWIVGAIKPGSITACFIWERDQAANSENEIYEK